LVTVSLLQRAKKAGYTVLFVTLDAYILGRRPSDMDNGYNPFLREDNTGVELGFMDPVFQKHFHEKHGALRRTKVQLRQSRRGRSFRDSFMGRRI
jgi:lactate 2-monooxygenase